MNRIDSRKEPCPKPVLMAKNALEKDGLPLEIMVDRGVPLLNVKRFLESRNISVSVIEDGESATIFCSEGDKPFKELTASSNGAGAEDVAIVICSSVLGRSDFELGEVLMKGFLGTLVERASPPAAIALINEGVKLALPDSSASESLGELEKKGCRVLVCGTCAKHFGITGSISVGTISNMFEITELMMEHSKTIVLG
ncbi:MAG: sulfurtransferase-like selenium metabolism protein YedF [Thermovirgaceae bacterium]|nr:sulfurtransferase-like selenium metabolism protein YedF [Thermovirgaceae bacterium]